MYFEVSIDSSELYILVFIEVGCIIPSLYQSALHVFVVVANNLWELQKIYMIFFCVDAVCFFYAYLV